MAKKYSLRISPPDPCSQRAPEEKGLLGLECLSRVAQSPEDGWESVTHLSGLATLRTWLHGTESEVFQLGLPIQFRHALSSNNTAVVLVFSKSFYGEEAAILEVHISNCFM